MGLGMVEVIVILVLLFGVASPILFWAPGLVELIVILFLFLGFIGVIFAAFYFLAKRLTIIGGKTCPHCAEKIQAAAKVCRYCQRDVASV
jgi:hypothetical protein